MDMSFIDWFWFLLTAGIVFSPVLLFVLCLPWGLRCSCGSCPFCRGFAASI